MPRGESAESRKPIPNWALACGGCGCLAVLLVVGAYAMAMSAFRDFTDRAKAAEADAILRELQALVLQRCEAGEDLHDLHAGPLPGTATTEGVEPDWTADPGFVRLGFAPEGRLLYSYGANADGERVVLTARGDLDGDGEESLRTIDCDLNTCTCSATHAVRRLE